MPLLCRNTDLGPPIRLSAWRKIALGTWNGGGDPSVYGTLELDAGPALAYLERERARSGARVTLTHFVGAAVGTVFARVPQINCLKRWGRLYPRRSIDIFFQVASDGEGQDLSGTTLRGVDRLSVVAIAREFEKRVEKIRLRGDPEYRQVKRTMGLLPAWATGFALRATSFVLNTLNLWSPLLGAPRDAFGGAMVTSIGSLGLDQAYAPLVPYTRVPFLVAVGAVRDAAVVVNGQVAVRPIIRLCATFDHRLIDGIHAGKMTRVIQEIFADPDAHLPLDRSASV